MKIVVDDRSQFLHLLTAVTPCLVRAAALVLVSMQADSSAAESVRVQLTVIVRFASAFLSPLLTVIPALVSLIVTVSPPALLPPYKMQW